MNEIVQISLMQFGLVYLLLLIVIGVMKKAKVRQTGLLIIASARMTLQLIIAGLVLAYIFDNPHPLFTVGYLALMLAFSIKRILSKNKNINFKFKLALALSVSFSGLFILLFFLGVVVGVNVFNPQYAIPIGGMVIGNSMTGIVLAMKTFRENIKSERFRIEALLNVGVEPKVLLLPFINSSLETALLPTLNSMLGMGIIALPGMMTGQILSGTMPMTAIMYQIAIMIAICTSVCLSVFLALSFGYKTLCNERNQINLDI